MASHTAHTVQEPCFPDQQERRYSDLLSPIPFSPFSSLWHSQVPSYVPCSVLFNPYLHVPESLFRPTAGRCMTCFFFEVPGKLGYVCYPSSSPAFQLLGPGVLVPSPMFPSLCDPPLAHGGSGKMGERRLGPRGGGAREPEGGETADIRSIQKWKDGELGGRRRV